MRIAIHQPSYIPWPPYLHKILNADIFVYLDNVQFQKNGVQNRHLIKTEKGPTWLTLPVRHHLGQTIMDTRVTDPKTLARHFEILRLHYRYTPGFKRWEQEVRQLCTLETDSLCEIAISSTEWILSKLGVRNRRLRASELQLAGEVDSARIAAICQCLGATEYLSGRGGLNYMKREDFDCISCRVLVQKWTDFEYAQQYPLLGFVPHLTTLDLLFNCPDTALGMIQCAGAWSPQPQLIIT